MKLTYEGLRNLISGLLIEKREDRIRELESYVDKGYFVHFFELPRVNKKGQTVSKKNTKIPSSGHKFGINPKSNFDTPLGIYGYPLTKQIYDQIIDESLPFALERLYLHIFKPKEGTNIIDLQNFTEEDLNYYVEKLKEIHPVEHNKIEILKQHAINGVEYVKKQTPGGIFWYITWKLQKGTLVWNKMFRRLGIDGFIDNGEGIIHDAEKTQAVFFTKLVVDHIDTIENPTTKSTRYVVKHNFNIDDMHFNVDNIPIQKLNYLSKILTKEDWQIISRRFKISLEFMKKFEKYLDLNSIFTSNTNITTDIINNYFDTWISKINHYNYAYYIAQFVLLLLKLLNNNNVSIEYIENLFDKYIKIFNNTDILRNFRFSENFLEKNLNYLQHVDIASDQNVSLKFIQDHNDIFGKKYYVIRFILNPYVNDEVRDWAQKILDQS